MGTRAFSHDSIFIPDGGAESEQTVQAMSQDNILGKVKTLQRQLGKNIKFGQPPPNAIPMKKAGSGEASLEEDLLPTGPVEIVTQQDIVLSDTENKSSDTPSTLSPLNLPGARSEMEEKVAPIKPSRPKRHLSSAGTIESVNLDAIPLAIARLDNSAAKHKLSVKPKNQRVSKRHRRLAGGRPDDQGTFLHQLSLDQNGHSADDKPICHQEEPEPLDSEEEKRRQEEYWRELEAKCKRQKAEAAERKRVEEERLQALERRLWEENRRQELLEEEGEEEEEELQLETEKKHLKEEHQRVERQVPQGQEQREPEEESHLEIKEQEQLKEEAEPLERPRQQDKLEAERQQQKEEERELEECRRLEELEEQKRREAEKQRVEEERRLEELRQLEEVEEQRRREEEERQMIELRRQEEEERKMMELRRQEEEERKMMELRRQEEEEKKMELRRQEEERKMMELRRQEEERKMMELRRQEEERKMMELRRQEEERKMMELRRQEEAKRREEQRRQEEMEAHRWQEVERELGGAVLRVDEGRRAERDKRGPRSPLQNDFAKESEEEHLKPKKQREDSKEPSVGEKQKAEAEPLGGFRGPRGDFHQDGDDKQQGKREEINVHHPPKQEAYTGETLAPAGKKESAAPEKDRKVEELRWQEVEERQTMPRPYTFQVSSGGKQILFPKVNLSPVTPLKDTGVVSASHEPRAPKGSSALHSLPSSLSVPHTAILVTGAQLCGPAVNLSQIKDTACKSLLGLSEEKKHTDVPTLENPLRAPGDPRAGLGKARLPQESPSSTAALAEWASIRSRILKGAESEQHGERDPALPSEEPHPRGRCDSRGSNPRKTPPVNAKFSIMPAWQKFSDGGADTSKQNAEAESLRKRAGLGSGNEPAPQPLATDAGEPHKGPEKLGVHPEPTDTTDGCKFAKDLPSFLVPSFPSLPQKAYMEPGMASDGSETAGGPRRVDPVTPGAEEKVSPFGIKLRRTNYSLRFHCDQQTEQKKKKRHSSTGDSGEAGPQVPGSIHGEEEREGGTLQPEPQLAPERKQAPSTRKDSADSSRIAQSRPPPATGQTPAPEHDKAAHKMPLVQKPALAPKPTSQTPPSSPLSKLSRPYLVELLARRAVKSDPESSEPCKEGQGGGDLQLPPTPPPEERKAQKKEELEDLEEAGTERKPTSPALPTSRQEKPSQTPEEVGKKEKPVLQSRHSVDGSKLAEKAEPSQPLWITLALQKQKGFREQQATREERKQAREAKQAEKISKENVGVSPQPSGSSSVSRAASLHKPIDHPEEKKPETAVSRLERREQLKKANTLPTSVTVEISDSAPSAPLVKEVAKRLSTPDAAPVSTEPAWLALAKRKAKAWSDCPQIIK
ncbi:capping protein-inhibiting regulator of actin dynamics isoform X2 [Erinaceus europaeus]|uniref:Capping protein-inhibiting regulator of actin dynamics isoform X2 n=1 Tax=Erinaceus europaeus TaxID=9365 RepID=A0ABM3X5D0_ERIEU|nr:capping protein-inhibiting regulator of actin dynamics isoform X2 [Erinaceus europaeus]